MEPEPFRLGDLAIHYEERRVTFAGSPIQLTATEYELLRVLSVNAGRVATYGALLRRVWGRRDRGDVRLVRSFVKRLRRKLGDDPDSPTYILTERGVGYRMAKPGDGSGGTANCVNAIPSSAVARLPGARAEKP